MTGTLPAALSPVLNSRYPHKPRQLFMLRRYTSSSAADFAAGLRAWCRRWPVEVGFGSVVARTGTTMAERQESFSGNFRAGGAEVNSFDGYASLDLECYDPSAADFATLLAAAKGCLDLLDGLIDPATSFALAGIANLVIPCHAPLEEYKAWWNHHADDHRRFNPAQPGYSQLHIAPELNATAAAAAGIGTIPHCVIDIMYHADLGDAFPKPGARSVEDRGRWAPTSPNMSHLPRSAAGSWRDSDGISAHRHPSPTMACTRLPESQ